MATEDRKRVGVPISGIDIAAPDHSVTDGKCETIHNLRYANGAWRNVHPFEGKSDLQKSDYKIIYHHPATKDNEYIAEINTPGQIALYGFFNRKDEYFYYLPNEVIGVGDAVYNDENELVGHVTSERTQQYTEVIVKLLSGDEVEMELDRDDSSYIPAIPSVHSVYWVRVESNGDITQLQKIVDIDGHIEVSVSHFGKVLIVSNHGSQKMMQFAFNGEKYIYYDTSSIWCKSTFSKSRVIVSPDVTIKFFDTTDDFEAQLQYGIEGKGIAAYEKICNADRTEWYYRDYIESNTDAWRGEFAIFFALRDESGEVLYRTAPQIINSAQINTYRTNTPDKESISTINPANDGNYYAYAGWKTDLPESSFTEDALRAAFSTEYHKFINVDCDIDYYIGEENFVNDVAIYATRLHSFFAKSDAAFANNEDIIQDPFYLMDVISINPLDSTGHITYSIGYDKLKNIEQKILFEPKIVSSSIYAYMIVEYNDRLHLISPTTKAPYISYDNIQEDATGASYAILKWQKNDITYNVKNLPLKQKFAITQWKMVSFPSSISCIYLADDTDAADNTYFVSGKIDLKYAAHIDYSYYIQYSGKVFFKYDYIDTSTNVSEEYLSNLEFTTSVSEPNRIQVSEANNCFVYPYENSYRIGSNTSTIVAANAAAIEMSDAKFGEFPLYVFTDEGVFAMQSGGSNTLYSAIVPISYDKAINPNTLAVNYNVLFVTERGVMSLNSQGVSLLSEGLNQQDNTIPEWMRTTKMMHAPQHNEVFATDIDNRRLYVFSLENNVWSTRDVEEGYIINNGVLVTSDKMIDLLHETTIDTPTNFTIVSRPIKLGSMELKRLETFILRFESDQVQEVSIQLSGSVDTVKWIKFREVKVYTNRDILIRRVPLSAKYLKVSVVGTAADDIKVVAIEMEYYLRLLHRMR